MFRYRNAHSNQQHVAVTPTGWVSVPTPAQKPAPAFWNRARRTIVGQGPAVHRVISSQIMRRLGAGGPCNIICHVCRPTGRKRRGEVPPAWREEKRTHSSTRTNRIPRGTVPLTVACDPGYRADRRSRPILRGACSCQKCLSGRAGLRRAAGGRRQMPLRDFLLSHL